MFKPLLITLLFLGITRAAADSIRYVAPATEQSGTTAADDSAQPGGVDADNLQRAYARLRSHQAEVATQPTTPEQQIAELRGIIAILRAEISDLKEKNTALMGALQDQQARQAQGARAAAPVQQKQTVKDGDLAVGMTLDQAEKSTHAFNVQLISEDADGTKTYRWRKTFPSNGSGSVFTGGMGWSAGMVTVIIQNDQVTSYQNDPAQ